MRGCLRRNWPEHLSSGHIRGQSCEAVSGGTDQTTMGQAMAEVNLAMMYQAELARTTQGRASPRSALRGCLWRKWPEHNSSGHPGTQTCEDVASGGGQTIMGQSFSEIRLSRMSQAKVAWTPELKASRNPELRGCSRREWPEISGAGHLRRQRCEDTSGDNGLTTSAQGTSD